MKASTIYRFDGSLVLSVGKSKIVPGSTMETADQVVDAEGRVYHPSSLLLTAEGTSDEAVMMIDAKQTELILKVLRLIDAPKTKK